MALQSYNIAVGNLTDDSQGNNYSVNAPVYITTENLVFCFNLQGFSRNNTNSTKRS